MRDPDPESRLNMLLSPGNKILHQLLQLERQANNSCLDCKTNPCINFNRKYSMLSVIFNFERFFQLQTFFIQKVPHCNTFLFRKYSESVEKEQESSKELCIKCDVFIFPEDGSVTTKHVHAAAAHTSRAYCSDISASFHHFLNKRYQIGQL